MVMPDPVQTFEHDRVRCTNLVRELGEHAGVTRKKSFSRRQLLKVIEQLRDELLTHFAREEEGLFPFIVGQLPDAKETVERLITAHDAICSSLGRLLLLTSQTDAETGLAAFDEFLSRFSALYAEHTRTEMGLLREIDERLDGAQRDKLCQLVSGL